MQGSGCRVQGSGSRAQDSGLRVGRMGAAAQAEGGGGGVEGALYRLKRLDGAPISTEYSSIKTVKVTLWHCIYLRQSRPHFGLGSQGAFLDTS